MEAGLLVKSEQIYRSLEFLYTQNQEIVSFFGLGLTALLMAYMLWRIMLIAVKVLVIACAGFLIFSIGSALPIPEVSMPHLALKASSSAWAEIPRRVMELSERYEIDISITDREINEAE